LRGNRRQRPPDGASHARRTESCLGPEKAEAPVSGSRPGPRERLSESCLAPLSVVQGVQRVEWPASIAPRKRAVTSSRRQWNG